jgi:hypothetical protein
MNKIKINYKKDLFKGKTGLCESIFCAPFEDSNLFKEEEWENNRFENIIKNGEDLLEFTDIENCDFVVIPYKWDNRSLNTSQIINESARYGKKVIALHNDDVEPFNRLTIEEGFMFTTTLQSNLRRPNEFSFPAFTGDFYQKNTNINRNIGFCGAITHPIRSYIIESLFRSNVLNTNFKIRSGFWAPEMSKNDARSEFIDNIKNTTFTLCIRGAGNFSYRLYETLMMGRIPIIINTNQVFPFERIVDYSKFSLIINDIVDIENTILKFINSKSDYELIEMQLQSREFWVEYCSPEGWLKNFTKEL